MPLALKLLGLGILIGVAPAGTSAAVIFSQFTIDEVSSQGQLRSGAGAADSAAIAGVAAEPEPAGDIFAIHVNSAQQEAILRVNSLSGAATKLADSGTIAAQLGTPYGQELSLVGGFGYSPGANKLYIAEDFYGAANEASLIAIAADSGAASLVSRSTDLSGLSDHSLMPDGTIAVTRAGAAAAGTVDPVTGTYSLKISETDLLQASPGSSSLPPETVGVNPVSGKAFLFAHGDKELFEVPDITAGTVSVSAVTPSEMASADLHDLTVDQYGNLYGLDVATNHLFIVRSTDKTVFSFPLANIGMALSRPAFAAVPWRGLAARVAGYAQTDLFLSSGDLNYGIVRVRFGEVASAVTDWTMY